MVEARRQLSQAGKRDLGVRYLVYCFRFIWKTEPESEDKIERRSQCECVHRHTQQLTALGTGSGPSEEPRIPRCGFQKWKCFSPQLLSPMHTLAGGSSESQLGVWTPALGIWDADVQTASWLLCGNAHSLSVTFYCVTSVVTFIFSSQHLAVVFGVSS